MIKEEKLSKDELLALIREKKDMSFKQQLRLAILLSLPAILAQFTSMMMQYIDASMVGRLGPNPVASIGLVASTTWLIIGFAMGFSSGFSVQIAQLLGANKAKTAREVMRQGLSTMFIFTLILALIAGILSPHIPTWLGATEEIYKDSYLYLLIYSIFLPLSATGWCVAAMIQASGDMKMPSIMYITMCILDVIFNYIFIYMLNLGVTGAALGTGVANSIVFIWALIYLLYFCKDLNIRGEKGSFKPHILYLNKAFKISSPIWLQNVVMRGAHIISTIIIAPLGPIAIAANAIAIIVESFCYMPGFGVQDSATTLIGQSLGAGQKALALRFAKITLVSGILLMSTTGFIMYMLAPQLMGLLTNETEVIRLGAEVLRIEAFAEPLFAISIAGYGICLGAGDTLIPSILNFSSIWLIRIGLASILTPKLGLKGFWIAMCIEINIRGILLYLRIRSKKWLNKTYIHST